MKKLLLVTLLSIGTINYCFGMLSATFYTQQSIKFLRTIVDCKNNTNLNIPSLQNYLNERIQRADKHPVNLAETKALCPDLCLAVTRNHLQTCPHARIACYFPSMVDTHRVYAVRKLLGCYYHKGVLADFEKEYEEPLEAVTSSVFDARLHTIRDDLEALLFQESKAFASAILTTMASEDSPLK